jgi:pimeloyl-ACP methyl ester carboxylesterase
LYFGAELGPLDSEDESEEAWNPKMTASPVWFGPPARPLFGWFHRPDDGKARAGVVLCVPLANEYEVAHCAIRVLAERLESLGICVLRFDYEGMGDSAGNGHDSDRVSAWVTSASHATKLLRSTGVDRVSVVGMRMGALLGGRMAAEDGDIDQMVLWDPCVSGKSFLAEQRALMAITFGVVAAPDGSVQGPGIVYEPETVARLNEIAFANFTAPLARRALVLTRSDRPAGRRLQLSLATSVEWDEAVGQAELMELGPPLQKLPYAAIERIATWLSDGTETAAVSLTLPPAPGAVTVGRDPEGRAITERPIRLGPAGLFGMLTEVTSVPATPSPVVVFLNVANAHHVGPSRMWVDLARRLAPAGINCVRVDLSGLGDSPLRHADQREFASLLPEAFEDVMDIAEAVSPKDPSNVVLIGASSSAYQAIESALELLPRGIVAMNPTLWFVPPERKAGRALDRRRAVIVPHNPAVPSIRGSTLHVKLRSRFPQVRLRLRTSSTRHPQLFRLRRVVANFGWRLRMLRTPSRRAGVWLGKLVDGGVDIFLLCGEWEARPIRVGASSQKLLRLTRTGRLRFECLPELDHSLMIEKQHRMVADMTAEHIVGKFAPRTRSLEDVPESESTTADLGPRVEVPLAQSTS